MTSIASQCEQLTKLEHSLHFLPPASLNMREASDIDAERASGVTTAASDIDVCRHNIDVGGSIVSCCIESLPGVSATSSCSQYLRDTEDLLLACRGVTGFGAGSTAEARPAACCGILADARRVVCIVLVESSGISE